MALTRTGDKTVSNKQALLKKMLAQTTKIREENAQKGQKFEKIDWFIPQKGENQIRILPHKDVEKGEVFYRQVSTHFLPIQKKDGGYAKIPVRCLRDFEEDCPMCNAFAKMIKSKNAKIKEDASWLRPSTKFLVNIINYAERKVQPYAMASTVFDEIGGWMGEFQSDISDLEEGRDFKVIKSVKGGKTEYSVRPSMKDTAVPDKLRPLIEAAPDLNSLYSSNERQRMDDYLESIGQSEAGEAEEEDDGFAAPKKAIANAAKKKAAPVEEEEVDEEEEEERPVKKAVKKAAPVEEDEEEEEEDDEDFIPEDKPSPAARAKAAAAKAKAAPAKKAAKVEEDEDDLGVDLDDEDLDKEFEDLDV